MRIIKLSPKDPDMRNRGMVDAYFNEVLDRRTPQGQFLITRGRISESGIAPNERIVFTYNGDILYQARASSCRESNSNKAESKKYPHYFCIDLKTIKEGLRSLRDLENELKILGLIPQEKNLVKTQAWPIVKEVDELSLSQVLERFLKK